MALSYHDQGVRLKQLVGLSFELIVLLRTKRFILMHMTSEYEYIKLAWPPGLSL